MKLVVLKKDLQAALAVCSKSVSTNNIVPITKCYLFAVKDSKLTISGTNTAVSVSQTIECQSENEFKIAIQADILNDLVGKIDQPKLGMMVKTEPGPNGSTYYTAVVKTSDGQYEIPAENGEDFVILKNNVLQTLHIDAEVLSSGISRTMFALDSDDTLPLGNLSIDFHNNRAIFSSGNKHIFATYEYEVEHNADARLMINPSAAQVIANLPVKGQVSVIIANNSVGFYWENGCAIAVLSDLKFVPLKDAIPLDNDIFVEVDRTLLKNANARVKTFTNRDTYELELQLSDTGIKMVANDYDFKKRAVELVKSSHSGSEIRIGLSGNYLNQCLTKLTGDTVYMQLKAFNKAVILRDYSDEVQKPENLILLMPIILPNQK